MSTPFDISELVDRLIDHLHDDPKTLKNTSCVARSWRSTIQLHLLHDVVVLDREYLFELRDDLRTNVQLRHLIVRLSIENLMHPSMEVVDALLDILYFLDRLQDLHLAVIIWGRVAGIDDVPRSREKVSRALHSLRLDRIEFSQDLYLFDVFINGILTIQNVVVKDCRSYGNVQFDRDITLNQKPLVRELYLGSPFPLAGVKITRTINKVLLETSSPRVLRAD